MKTPIHLALVLGAGLMLGACGNDLCDRLAKDAEACGETLSDDDVDECKASIEPCSKSDEKKFGQMFDCFEDEGLTACETTTSSTSTSSSTTGFDGFAALLACVEIVQDVSPECLESMSLFDATTSTYSTSYTYTTPTTTSGG